MESISEPVQLGLGVAAAFFIVGKFLEWAPKVKALLRNDKSHNPAARMAGEHPPEYWQIEQRKAVADVVTPLMEAQSEILKQMVSAEREQTEAFRELAREFREDRAMERGRQEARRR